MSKYSRRRKYYEYDGNIEMGKEYYDEYGNKVIPLYYIRVRKNFNFICQYPEGYCIELSEEELYNKPNTIINRENNINIKSNVGILKESISLNDNIKNRKIIYKRPRSLADDTNYNISRYDIKCILDPYSANDYYSMNQNKEQGLDIYEMRFIFF